MRKVLTIIAFLSSACFLPHLRAQGVSVTVNTLGAEPLKNYTGQTIKGVRLLNTLVCPDDGTREFSGGRVWQAAIANNVSPELPDQARLTLNRPVQFNWRNMVITAVGLASGGLVAISTGNIVAMGVKVISALAIGHVFWDQASPVLKSQVPDPSEFLQTLLDPTKPIAFDSQGDCYATHMVAQFSVKLPPTVGPFHVGAAPAPAAQPVNPTSLHVEPQAVLVAPVSVQALSTHVEPWEPVLSKIASAQPRPTEASYEVNLYPNPFGQFS